MTADHATAYLGKDPLGRDIFRCSECGRCLAITWPGEDGRGFDVAILAPGDERAAHSGGKGGLSLSAQASQSQDPPEFVEWAAKKGKLLDNL